MSCSDCTRDVEHCHGTLVVLAGSAVECTDPGCRDIARERHDLVVVAVPDR
ncbi:hypothetical protein [Pseudonocardia sp. MH-G8]|uniref:hypothetical protein n=1 Tax=Pseudonocardia sp. MH-G8 TaxID=1854588 RepID=UPI001303FDA2|nr:hypothetical protein [Pseudonocardia sp. MH-G8]